LGVTSLSAIIGFFAALSRISGILIAIPYILELIESNKDMLAQREFKKWLTSCLKQGIWILLIPCGIIVYLMINYHYTGDCFKFMEYQQKFWFHTSCYFGKGIQNMWNDVLSTGRDWRSKLDLFIPQSFSYTFAALLMLLCCRRHKSQYSLYFAAYFILNTGITWSMSGARYASLAIPMYIMLAELTENNDLAKFAVIALSAALYGIYSTMYFGGYQIM
jgi:hypothetical protein